MADNSTTDGGGPPTSQQQSTSDGQGTAGGAGGVGTAAAPPELMSSFFPSPPSIYTQYTPRNLELARSLTSHPSFKPEVDDWRVQQEEILKDRAETVKDLDLRWLTTPPDVSLIEEDGHWMAFGQAWPINEALPSLEEMGVKQLFRTPETFEDRRQALHSLLRTALHTYLRLLSVLIQGPPSIPSEQERFRRDPTQLLTTQADQLIEHLKLTTINIHHICNEWRPVQARETLKLILRNQIDERKEKIKEMTSACQGISDRLEKLKTRLNRVQGGEEEATEAMSSVTLTAASPSQAQAHAKQSSFSVTRLDPSEKDGRKNDPVKSEAKRRLKTALDAIGD